jgi:excisionase family DNA binding protein
VSPDRPRVSRVARNPVKRMSHDENTCVFCQAEQAGRLAPGTPADIAARVAALIMALLEQLAAHQRRLLTITEVSQQLGLSKSVVYELMYTGDLRSVEIPSRNGKQAMRRFEQAEVDAFVARHRVEHPATRGAF